MKCRMIFDGLVSIDQGNTDVPVEVVRGLLSEKLLVEIKTRQDMTAEEEAARAELKELSARHRENTASIAKLERVKVGDEVDLPPSEMSEYERLKEEDKKLSAKMSEVRKRLIVATGRPGLEDCVRTADGRNVQITYKGREAIHTIGARLDRVGDMEYGEIVKEMDKLKQVFETRAKRASIILKAISPRMKKHEEIYLRSSAVGLSGIMQIEPKPLAREFRRNWLQQLDVRYLIILFITFFVQIGILLIGLSTLRNSAENVDVNIIQKQYAHLLLDKNIENAW